MFRKFAANEHGGIAILFALMAMVLFTVIGIAVDVARTESVRSEVQSALDDALLSAAAQSRRQDADPIELAKKYFNENWTRKFQDTPVDIQIIKDEDGSLTGNAIVALPTTITKVAGLSTLTLDLSATVTMGEGAVELVLALDTTGSMAGAKIDTLKSSASELVETLFDVSSASERIKIGVVPFAQYVNVGMENRNEIWMSVDEDSSETVENCYDKREIISKSNCRTETGTGSNDGVPYTYEYEACDYEYGDPKPVCEPYTATTTWYGCAGSRSYPLNIKDKNFTSSPVPGVMNMACGTPALPLTNEKGDVLDTLTGLSASGETYIPAGLTWGWRALSQDVPFTGGAAYGATTDGIPVRKILVLMTDGTNTKSPDYPTHNDTDQYTSDTLSSELCVNIKKVGIEIYTVAFEVTDNDTKTLLKTCASSPGNFFDATSNEALRTAFVDIAKDVTPLRLAK